MIVGLIPADDGQIAVNGTDVTKLSMHRRARLGISYLPQEASVFRKLSVRENILAILQLREDMSRSEQINRTEQLLEELHIGHIRDSLGMSLSGGERRRVEIARALCSEPKFILLDEPFAGVDPITVIEIQKIVADLVKRDIGVLITDHNVRETLGICERAYILNEGKVLTSGSPEEVLKNEQVKTIYLGENFAL